MNDDWTTQPSTATFQLPLRLEFYKCISLFSQDWLDNHKLSSSIRKKKHKKDIIYYYNLSFSEPRSQPATMKTLCSMLVATFVARLCACDLENNSKQSPLNSKAKTSEFSVSNTSTSNINNARESARNEALHIHYALIQLDKFVRNLKFYVSETHFRYPVFETQVAELGASFSEIAELCEHVIPCPENLTRQI